MRQYGDIAPVPMRFALTIVVIWLCSQVTAQNETRYSNIRTRTLPAHLPVQLLDSLSVSPVPGAVTDNGTGDTLPASFFFGTGRIFTHRHCRIAQVSTTVQAIKDSIQNVTP